MTRGCHKKFKASCLSPSGWTSFLVWWASALQPRSKFVHAASGFITAEWKGQMLCPAAFLTCFVTSNESSYLSGPSFHRLPKKPVLWYRIVPEIWVPLCHYLSVPQKGVGMMTSGSVWELRIDSCVSGTGLRPLHTWSYLILRAALWHQCIGTDYWKKKKLRGGWLLVDQHQARTKFASYFLRLDKRAGISSSLLYRWDMWMTSSRSHWWRRGHGVQRSDPTVCASHSDTKICPYLSLRAGK